MGIKEKIADLELEMARTQKNKATEGHLGILKSKLAKLRTELLEPAKGPGSEATGFEVVKYGDARIALIGFPSVGKSTALSLLTGTESEAASYEFTTLTCIPGIIHYKGTKIQLLDLPGIIEGAAHGKGRGRQVIAVAKSADLVLMMLDATKPDAHRSQYMCMCAYMYACIHSCLPTCVIYFILYYMPLYYITLVLHNFDSHALLLKQ